MALNEKFINGSVTRNSKWYSTYMQVIENSININNNSSNVTVIVYVKRNSYGYYTSKTTQCYINLSGDSRSFTIGAINWGAATSGTVEIARMNADVPHSPDGKATIFIDYSWDSGSNPYSPGICSAEGEMILTNIARQSTLTATDCYIESATSINIARADSRYKHKLAWAYEGSNNFVEIANNVDTTYGWTVPKSVYANIPNSQIQKITLRCQTFDGSNKVGNDTFYTFTARVEEEKNSPDLSIVYKDVNPITLALTGNNQKIIRLHSNMNVKLTGTAKNYATIVKYFTNYQGGYSDKAEFNYTPISSLNLPSVTDSRNFVTQGDINYKPFYVPYYKLNYNKLELKRVTQTSSIVKLNLEISWYQEDFGLQENALIVKYRKRVKGGSYGGWTDISSRLNTQTKNIAKITDYTISTTDDFEKTYEYEFELRDKLEVITPTKTLEKGIYVFGINEDFVKTNVILQAKKGIETTTFNGYTPTKIKELWSGNLNIPSIDSGNYTTIQLKESLENYDFIMLFREEYSTNYLKIGATGDNVGASISYYSDFANEGFNVMLCNVRWLNDKTQLQISNNAYSGISKLGEPRFFSGYEGFPLNFIYGIKI